MAIRLRQKIQWSSGGNPTESVFNSADGTFYAASHRTTVWIKLMRFHVSLLAMDRS
jgi:hypothetical protein